MSQSLAASQSFKHALASPVFTFEEKTALLHEMAERTGSPSILKQFCEQLLRKNRASLLPEIAQAFSDLVDEKNGLKHVSIASANELSSAEQQELHTELTSKLNRAVKIKFETEPSLIAGLQIRIGSRVIDNTVRGKLANMRTRLAKG
ncbi:MAG: hypothetical protein NPIRA02_38080 [Nitrospirales bacterium]|nr:MAG: hypothetical protein NPIRA02_38080 [Nitrospirales bacterium]